MQLLSHTLILTFLTFSWLSSPGAQTLASAPVGEETIWLHIAFDEINSASPVVGEATFPVQLAHKVIAALPPKTLQECKESGFDIPVIAGLVDQLKVGQHYESTVKEYHLRVTKIARTLPAEPKATYLAVNNPKFPIKVPLTMTPVTVKMLQLYYKELKDMEQQLTAVVEEIQQTPPTLLLKGEDKLMDSWLQISLE
ncbi:MAG: hypothetical protein RBU29_03755 [bacterium]|jgi:hypothetical protein|nr:hypothetical protein [bacterium]